VSPRISPASQYETVTDDTNSLKNNPYLVQNNVYR